MKTEKTIHPFMTEAFYADEELTLTIFNTLYNKGHVVTSDTYDSGEILYLDVKDNDETRALLSQVISNFPEYIAYNAKSYFVTYVNNIGLCSLQDIHAEHFGIPFMIIWDDLRNQFKFYEEDFPFKLKGKPFSKTSGNPESVTIETSLPAEVWQGVADEMERALKKHPEWPDCMVRRVNIITEEMGELARAVNEFEYDGGNVDDMINEAEQTAATTLRMLHALLTEYPKCKIYSTNSDLVMLLRADKLLPSCIEIWKHPDLFCKPACPTDYYTDFLQFLKVYIPGRLDLSLKEYLTNEGFLK